MSAIRVSGTYRSSAILFMLSPSGFMNSSRRISPGCTGLSFLAMASSLVVVRNFDLAGIAVSPFKADAPLVVDPNAVLALAVPSQPFEPVPRKRRQDLQTVGCVEQVELAKCGTLDRPKLPAGLPTEEPLGLRRAKGLDHSERVYFCP